VLYLIEAVDEYCIQSLPEFEGKKFQNAAKEGFKLDASEKAKERKDELQKEFEPLLTWMKEDALKDKVEINFYVRRLYRQVLLRARISYGDSVCLSVRLSAVS